MSRNEARIPYGLWSDPEFIRRTEDAQWLALFLYSQGDVSACGSLLVMPRRWASRADGMTVERIRQALNELVSVDEPLIAVDDEHEEVLLLKFFKWESIHKQPRRTVAAYDAIAALHSPLLRATASTILTHLVDGSTPPVPTGMRAVILHRDGYRCSRCGWAPGDPIPEKKGKGRPVYRGLELDHIHPKSKGGPDHPDNLQVLCTSCNSSKGARI